MGTHMSEMSDMVTRAQMIGALQVVEAVRDAIGEAPDGLPLGEMYAMLMSRMSYETFMGIIKLLTDANQITVSNHVAKRVK